MREPITVGGHLRIRPFNTAESYPEQRLDNDLCQAVVAGSTVYLRGQVPQDLETGESVHSGNPAAQAMTFSLVGRCDRTGAVGAVIASASMAVAARCAAARAGVGAVCSQSTTDPRLREALLEAMAGGVAADEALVALVNRTEDIAYRQLAVVDAAGGSACYSGELALGEAADVCAAGGAAAGNLLADRGVPAAMLRSFQDTAGESLGDRLIAALRAGLAAGGEVSPVRSAGMVIAESVPWPVTDLRVDWHEAPVGRLALLWEAWQPQADSYVQRALRPAGT